jgi:hypothetical protein
MQPLTPEPQGAGLGALPLPRGAVSDAEVVKLRAMQADRESTMIISDKQVRLAVDYLLTHDTDHEDDVRCEVPEQLLRRVRETLEALPETRDERVSEAWERLNADPPSADEVAAKIIGRAISDSLR